MKWKTLQVSKRQGVLSRKMIGKNKEREKPPYIYRCLFGELSAVGVTDAYRAKNPTWGGRATCLLCRCQAICLLLNP